MSDKLTATFVAPVGYKVTDAEFKDDGSVLLFMNKSKHPHAELIAQCEQDKIDYPDFWWKLWQLKRHSEKEWRNRDSDIFFDSFETHDYRQHPHRKSIIAWHACSDDDKKRWECRIIGTTELIKNDNYTCDYIKKSEPAWNEDIEYILRPRTCKVTLQDGTVMEYPEPCRYFLKLDDVCWCVFIHSIVRQYKNEICYKSLKAGVIHLTEQAAQQHFKVLQAVNAQIAI